MREILFRGKRVDDGEWVEGYFHEIEVEWDRYEHGMLPTKYQYVITPINFVTRESIDIIPATIGQYTGLKDKNGVKIFEGDIVKCVELIDEVFREYVSEVYLDIGCWLVDESKTCSVDLYLYDNSNPTKMPLTEIEVIGNIYDNPELLGEEV